MCIRDRIGKEDSIRATAQVAFVSPGACAELADAVVAAGHEVRTYASWAEWSERAAADATDLVFCDVSVEGDVPAGLEAPVLRVDASSFAVADTLSALLALATELAGRQARLRDLEHVVEGLRSGAAIVGSVRCV